MTAEQTEAGRTGEAAQVAGTADAAETPGKTPGLIPGELHAWLRPVTVVVGHYGAGKTNFCVNLALDAAASGYNVSVIDLDVVNPYFRASEQRVLLEEHGVQLIAPVFAEAGTSLDVPSLTGQISPALQSADEGDLVIVDAGGDDVGATALGRYATTILQQTYTVLYIANAFRNLVADPHDALENLREIELASHLHVKALVNNSHLKAASDAGTIARGIAYAQELAGISGLPLACTTLPAWLEEPQPTPQDADSQDAAAPGKSALYRVEALVKNPWE